DISPLLMTLLAQKGGAGNPASINRGEALKDTDVAQQQWLQAKSPDNGITFNGPTPQGDIYFTLWKIPWNPIAISWAIDFYQLVSISRSTGNGYPKDTVLKKLKFSRQSYDYEYPDGTQFAAIPQQYQSAVLLSSGATVDLRAQIEQYLRYNDDEELTEILK